MTEQIVSLIPIEDLSTVRIRCKSCKTVFEFNTRQLVAAFENQQCPHCRAALDSATAPALVALNNVLAKLQGHQTMEVEFVVRKAVS